MLFYTLDGSEPTTKAKLYKRPFIVKKQTPLRVKAFYTGMSPSEEAFRKINIPTTLGEVILESQPSAPYKGSSPTILIDGERADHTSITSGKWMGFQNKDAEVVIDLGEERKIRKIRLGYLHSPGKKVFAPSEVNVEVSNDAFNYKGFRKLNKIKRHDDQLDLADTYETPIYNTTARYIYIHAKNPQLSKESWIMIDEISVE